MTRDAYHTALLDIEHEMRGINPKTETYKKLLKRKELLEKQLAEHR